MPSRLSRRHTLSSVVSAPIVWSDLGTSSVVRRGRWTVFARQARRESHSNALRREAEYLGSKCRGAECALTVFRDREVGAISRHRLRAVKVTPQVMAFNAEHLSSSLCLLSADMYFPRRPMNHMLLIAACTNEQKNGLDADAFLVLDPSFSARI